MNQISFKIDNEQFQRLFFLKQKLQYGKIIDLSYAFMIFSFIYILFSSSAINPHFTRSYYRYFSEETFYNLDHQLIIEENGVTIKNIYESNFTPFNKIYGLYEDNKFYYIIPSFARSFCSLRKDNSDAQEIVKKISQLSNKEIIYKKGLF